MSNASAIDVDKMFNLTKRYNNIFFLILLISVSNRALTESYQSFTGISHSDSSGVGSHIQSLESTYFFHDRRTLGPLNEFSFINQISNIYFSANKSGGSKNVSVGGDFIAKNFLLQGQYYYDKFDAPDHVDDDRWAYNISLGYYLSNHLLVTTRAFKSENINTSYSFTVDYNYQINEKDYIGFRYFTPDDFDSYSIYSKYYRYLSHQRYLSLVLSYADNPSEILADFWIANVTFYLNKRNSISAQYDKGDNFSDSTYSLGIGHYLTEHYGIQLYYSDELSDSDSDNDYSYGARLTLQY